MSRSLSIPTEDPLKLIVCTPQAQKLAVVESFLQQLPGKTTLTRADAPSFAEVYDLAANEIGALILMSVMTKEDLPAVLQILAKLDKKLADGTHRVFICNQLNNEKVVDLLKSKGVFEVLDPKVSIKAFQYKFNKCVQMIEQSVKRAKLKADDAASGAGGGLKGAAGAGNGKQKKVGQVVFASPIEHFSDFWLLIKPKDVRFVIGKWFVNFYGPGPSSGEWKPFSESKNGEQGWIWNLRNEADKTFYKDEGRWVFFGNCPEFSWEEKHWYFISKAPEFSFYKGKDVVHTKYRMNEVGDVDFCQNSKAGEAYKPAIHESIEASIRLNDSNKVKKSEESIEKDKEKKAPEFREKEKEQREYKGRFAEEFEERKKKHNKSYEAAELKLGLLTKNGLKLMNKVVIELIELREKYVVLDVPAGMLAVDDQIELEAFLKEDGVEKKVTISAATQIVETESEADADASADKHEPRSVAICELNDKIAPQFIELVQSFKSKRENMSDFFNKAKGAA